MNSARTLRSLAVLCLVVCASAQALAAPPEPAAEPEALAAEDPRVDTLARFHAALLMRQLTGFLFARVEGPNADLCRIDHRDASGVTTRSRWVRFSERRWEVAYQPGGVSENGSWARYVVELDPRGRLEAARVTIEHENQPHQTYVHGAYDWSPEAGFVTVTTHGVMEYVVDDEDPKLLRSRFTHGSGSVSDKLVRVTSSSIDARDVKEPKLIGHTITWREGGAMDMVFRTGQSTQTHRFDAHGALSRRTSVPFHPGNPAQDTATWSVQLDEEGRPATADIGAETVTAHLVYGCAWPEALEQPAPPDVSGQAGGH